MILKRIYQTDSSVNKVLRILCDENKVILYSGRSKQRINHRQSAVTPIGIPFYFSPNRASMIIHMQNTIFKSGN